jgi:hypothetical protein
MVSGRVTVAKAAGVDARVADATLSVIMADLVPREGCA